MKAQARLLALMFLLAAATACEDEAVQPSQPGKGTVRTASFAEPVITVAETGSARTIEIRFSEPVRKDGTLTLTFDATKGKYFTSVPAASSGRIIIPVTAGQREVSLEITPVDNTVMDPERSFHLELLSLPDNFAKGTVNKTRLTITDDEVPVESRSFANFLGGSATIVESETEGRLVKIRLSENGATGSITLKITAGNAEYGKDYTTDPEFVNGTLTLNTTPGTNEVSFRLLPVNNSLINGETQIVITITETHGNVDKGTVTNEEILLRDDELIGKPKGYEVFAGQWGMKRTVNYHPDGRVKSIDIEEAFPTKRTRTETYIYDSNGRLEKVNLYANIDRVFIWENDRIIREEKINHGEKREYVNYDYDDYGNIAGSEHFWLDYNGQWVKTAILVHLYYTDGNLFKTMLYSPRQDQEEPYLVSIKTYTNYIAAENPFPMGDILPNIKSQKKLHSTYILEEGGHTFNFNLSFEYNDDGKVTRRTATAGNISETAVYYYY